MHEYLTSSDYDLIADALDIVDPDDARAHARKQELESYFRQMAATGRGVLAEAPPLRVLVALEGGIVQGTVADVPCEVVVVDYDTEDADDDRLFDVPQDDGTTSEAFVGRWDALVDPAFITGAIEASPVKEPVA